MHRPRWDKAVHDRAKGLIRCNDRVANYFAKSCCIHAITRSEPNGADSGVLADQKQPRRVVAQTDISRLRNIFQVNWCIQLHARIPLANSVPRSPWITYCRRALWRSPVNRRKAASNFCGYSGSEKRRRRVMQCSVRERRFCSHSKSCKPFSERHSTAANASAIRNMQHWMASRSAPARNRRVTSRTSSAAMKEMVNGVSIVPSTNPVRLLWVDSVAQVERTSDSATIRLIVSGSVVGVLRHNY
jgi:hypothetical protein